MKPLQLLPSALLLALALAASPASPAPAAESQDSLPLILDLSRLHAERFITETGTNSTWKAIAGRQVFDGLPFQIDGRGEASGKKLGQDFPDFLGIAVGRKFDELHLIHVTQWADAEGQQIATVRLNYADGSKHEFPIRFGGQVRDWFRMPSEEKELLTEPNSKIIWRGPGAARIKATNRIFKSMLPNPHPEKVVATLDVLSSRQLAYYDLLAATVANRDPNRSVTPPCPAEGPERRFDGTLTVRVVEQGTGRPVAGALVDPKMDVDETSVIGIPAYTAASGEALFRYPVGRATKIRVSAEKEGYGSKNATAELAAGKANRLELELVPAPKLTGVARDGAGAPLAGVRLIMWPEWRANAKPCTTDATGHYVLSWNPRQDNQSQPIYLIAQDLAKNLALAQEVDPEATNLDLSLEPGLAVAGHATDTQGKVITNAEVEVMFWAKTGPNSSMGANMGKPVKLDAKGTFELKALPPGRQYGIYVSAKGFGRVGHTVHAEDNDNRRIELESFELPIADQHIAGVVLDADDKPVAKAHIYGYGDGQPGVSSETDSQGRFSFNQVCAGVIRLNANTPQGAFGSVTAEGGDTNITLQLGVTQSYSASSGSSKITGVVTDPEGKPAPKVHVVLFPSYNQDEKLTDAQGRFTLLWDPNRFGGMPQDQRVVVARDFARNLAAAVELEEQATNATLKLAPALTLVGRVTDAAGKALTNAEAHALFHTERQGSPMDPPSRADAEGRFEIKSLPPGRHYGVNASARGFGQETRDLPASEVEASGSTNQAAALRVDLEPFQLPVADQPLAGVVLDSDDKPVANANVYCHGDKQPNHNVQSDLKGRFSLDKVCAGPIHVSASTPRGGYGTASVQGGDTNVTIQMTRSGDRRSIAPTTAKLKGKPLPDLAPLGLAAADCPADQPLLAIVVDAEQRPSRRALRLLADQAPALKQKGIAIIALQMGGMAEPAFADWKKEAALPFPIGCAKTDSEKARAAWGAAALPWLILTDKSHKVVAEGFGLDELEAKLQALGK